MAMAVRSVELASQCVVLQGVSWETYERLLADFRDSHAAHLTYDQGVLEILVPSAKHEEPNRALALLIEMLALNVRPSCIQAQVRGSTSPGCGSRPKTRARA